MRGPRAVITIACLSAMSLVACEPEDRRPGLWLSGEPVAETVTDWSFTDDISKIFLETRTWYLVPHSVTVTCVALGDTLYVPTVYPRDAAYPEARLWNRNVVRDPRVRLKIGERVYERRAVLVEDPAKWSAILAAFARKSPARSPVGRAGWKQTFGVSYTDFWKELSEAPESERPQLIFLRMDPRESAAL